MRGTLLLLAVLWGAALAQVSEDPWGNPEEDLAQLWSLEPEENLYKTCTGWVAQELCSTIFGSGIAEDVAIEEDVGVVQRLATWEIDYENRKVTTVCVLDERNQTYTSLHRKGIGCTLVETVTEEDLRRQDLGDLSFTPLDPNVAWPEGEKFDPELIPDEVNLRCVQRVAERNFAFEPFNTRAMVISYKGRLVFERYAPTVNKDMPLLGWSATKSLINAMIGILVGEGRLDIHKPAPVPEWANDERANITLDMMLRMSSGTQWVGDIFPTTGCLFYSNNDCAGYCATKPLVAEPDTLFNYNSGSTYIMSRVVKENRGDRQWNDFEWPKKKFFQRIGANSAYIEHQPSGMMLGGAWGYMTARDWNRFGLLFLRDGVWIDGTRILPEGWAEYSGKASHTSPNYAAQFWKIPEVDEKLFVASGFRNQNVFIFPDHDLVISRFAMPTIVSHPLFQNRRVQFLKDMLECFPEPEKSA